MALLFAVAEPVLGADENALKYAITQGGLLCVALVLLWYIKNLHQGRVEEQQQRLGEEKERTAQAHHVIEMLTELVGQTSATMQKTITVGEALEKSTDRLTSAVQRMVEDRRTGFDRRTEPS